MKIVGLVLMIGFICVTGVCANNNLFDDNGLSSVTTPVLQEAVPITLNINTTPVKKAVILPVVPSKTLVQTFDSLNNFDSDILARVKFIPDNDEAFYSRWRIIEAAKETIDCTYYIVDKDIYGQAFLGLLARKAQQGVKIRLMIDGRIYRSVYMKGMPDRFQELAAYPNVKIKIFNSVLKSLFHAVTDFKGLFASNHDKILISDGKTSIIGGRNIGPDYFSAYGEYPIIYRDADIVIEGENVASRLKMAFDGEWNGTRNSVVKPDFINFKSQKARLEIADQVMVRYMNGKGLLSPDKTALPAQSKKILQELNDEISKYKNISSFDGYEIFSNETYKQVKIIGKQSSLGKFNDITKSLEAFIDSAREEIVIQTPYIVLTKEAEAALKRASVRGVKIIFHSNSGASTNSLFPQAFLMNDWQRILAEMPTCRIFVAPSEKERLHSKIFVFDSTITIIGSYNLDPQSQNLFSEVVAVVNDEEFSIQIHKQIEKDMEVVIEYKIKIGPKGEIIKVFGPEDHVSAAVMKKINFYRKLKWIRPIV